MEKWRLIIDVAKCENCNNCFLACKDEHCGNQWPGYAAPQPLHGMRWMNIRAKERGQFPLIDVAYLPSPCMHCDDPPCAKAAKDGAVVKREDGIVLLDPVKARGQRQLVSACPYGAIGWNQEAGLPQKCTLCAHLLDQGWKAPRCVQACPTGALSIIKCADSELENLAGKQGLQTLTRGDHSAKLNVYYKNLYRYTHCFIAGSVAMEKNGIIDCVKDAGVILKKDNTEIAQTLTDCFGDFVFDRLPNKGGEYEISISFGDQHKNLWATLSDSQSLGVIYI